MTKHNRKTCPDCIAHATDWKTSLKLAWKMLRGDDDWLVSAQTVPPSRLSQQRVRRIVKNRLDAREDTLRQELGWKLSAIEAGYIVHHPRTPHQFPRWSFLCTVFDPIDRAYGAPPRFHVWTPLGHITLAIGKHGKIDDKWFEFRLRDEYRCDAVTLLLKEDKNTVFARYLAYAWCPLRKGHKGLHAHPWTRTRLERPAISLRPTVDT